MIVMGLGGLWHGAGWNYVVWGLAQGLLLVGHRMFRDWCAGRPGVRAALESAAGTTCRIAATFLCWVLTMVIFRAPTLTVAGTMLGRMLRPTAGAPLTSPPVGLLLTLAAVAVAHAIGAAGGIGRLIDRVPRPVRGIAFGSAAAWALVLAPPVNRLFVYFQF